MKGKNLGPISNDRNLVVLKISPESLEETIDLAFQGLFFRCATLVNELTEAGKTSPEIHDAICGKSKQLSELIVKVAQGHLNHEEITKILSEI